MASAEYHRKWFHSQTDEWKARKVNLQKERKKEIRKFVNNYKKLNPCKCGESDISCLDFHHTSSNKEFNIGNLSSRGWSLKRITKEIEKCIIMCSNCHRKEHAKS